MIQLCFAGIKHSVEGKGDAHARYTEIPTTEALEDGSGDGASTPPKGSRGSDDAAGPASANGKAKLAIGMSVNQINRGSRKSDHANGEIEISGVEPADGVSAAGTLVKRGAAASTGHS